MAMRTIAAVILASVGLTLAVGIPITLAVVFDIDLGTKPGVLVGGMMPGIGVMGLAAWLWNGGPARKPTPDLIPPGHQACADCGTLVPVAEGVARLHDLHSSTSQAAFVCAVCTRRRTRRALTVLVLFLAGLGVFALVVQLTIGR